MRLHIAALSLLVAIAAFGQSDRGTITGTISDPAGAVVANATVEARNVDTGAITQAASSTTGNYTIAELPAGTYELDVTVTGFKKFVRTGLIVQAAQTIRVDARLDVGNTTESVTISAEAPLLKTESGELSSTVSTQTMDTLPLLNIGSNSSGIRNPFNMVALMPGAYYQPAPPFTGPVVHINGNPAGSETVLVDGMDGTNILGQGANQQNQPGMDSIQEWTVQTSNYSAEYGQAGSAVMNITMKSGTNQYHGSAYEYFQNEFLNAGQPFTTTSSGLLRPQQRRNDYGLTLGGPVRIPKIYNGKDKTFFFFSWEQYLQNLNDLPAAFSIPTQAYRNGDFSQAIAAAGNKNLGNDPLGRPIMANEIYDPSTRSIAPNGQIVTNPFPNNTIPLSRMDPVARKVQSMLPLPFCVAGPPCNANGVVNNFQNTEPVSRDTEAPSLKLDQLIGPNNKLSFFWGKTRTYTQTGYGEDGLPQPISYTFGGGIHSHRERLNYDRTLSPTVLLHLGAGFDTDYLGRPSVTPFYDACAGIGLCSEAFQPGTFPSFTGLYNSTGGGFGSALEPQIGPPGRADNEYTIFDSIASLTWVKGNHTFKFGGNAEFQGSYTINVTDLQGTYGFSSAQTALPYLVNNTGASSTSNIGTNSVGFPYASFLLGAVDTAQVDPPSRARFGKQQWGFYAQDSWKVTRKLTLDLGLRYDYSTYYTEQYGRSPNFAPNLPNPTAGGQPGAVIYQATCHCAFAKNYPWGLGPRFGFAYQVAPKTVFRGGFGVEYTPTGVAQTFGSASGNAVANNQFGPVSTLGGALMTLGQGVTINGQPLTASQVAWPNFSTGFYPIAGVLPGTGPQYYDQNAGRPARQYQYSFSVQHQITGNLVLEASYIGNRGIWWPTYLAPGGATGQMVNYNYLSNALLSHYGLSLNNPADLAILVSPLNSPAAGPFMDKVPFTGFPLTATVAQSLRPFPQFNTSCSGLTTSGPCPLAAPLGDTWYNAFQLTANKRFSHGLQADFAFTWSKSMNNFGGTPDVQNRGLAKDIDYLDQPFVAKFGITYSLPKWGPKALSYVVRDWMLNAFGYYASGIPLAPPVATTAGYPSNLSQATMANLTFQPGQYQLQVPGVPLYTHDLNCRCFDPNTTVLLNPAAWTNPAPGQYGGATYYNNFRGERRPVENFGIGRQFRVRERMSLTVRAEFNNIFNRTYLNNPTTTGVGISPQTAPTCKLPTGGSGACSPGEQLSSGFGVINTSTTFAAPRTGQMVAQFVF
ncbi:MAG TPA: TonB-dependent receptor [Bryobacteraceae bacterium]|nr:TonB-dependent receptor [Bryobacteraceae bacterium]